MFQISMLIMILLPVIRSSPHQKSASFANCTAFPTNRRKSFSTYFSLNPKNPSMAEVPIPRPWVYPVSSNSAPSVTYSSSYPIWLSPPLGFVQSGGIPLRRASCCGASEGQSATPSLHKIHTSLGNSQKAKSIQFSWVSLLAGCYRQNHKARKTPTWHQYYWLEAYDSGNRTKRRYMFLNHLSVDALKSASKLFSSRPSVCNHLPGTSLENKPFSQLFLRSQRVIFLLKTWAQHIM